MDNSRAFLGYDQWKTASPYDEEPDAGPDCVCGHPAVDHECPDEGDAPGACADCDCKKYVLDEAEHDARLKAQYEAEKELDEARWENEKACEDSAREIGADPLCPNG